MLMLLFAVLLLIACLLENNATVNAWLDEIIVKIEGGSTRADM